MGIAMKHQRAKQWHAFVNRTASHAQKPVSPEAVDLSYQPSAVEAGFSSASLGAERQEKGTVQLLYDSCAQPARAGIRSGGIHVRQILYRAEPYQIDLQVEAQPDRNRVVVTGQLVDVRHPAVLNAGMQVTLSDGRENVMHTLTNQFGEFRSEVNLSGYLELTFAGRDEKPIVILLRGTPSPTSRPQD